VIADLSDKYDKLPENHPFRRELARMIHDLAVELERREREAFRRPMTSSDGTSVIEQHAVLRDRRFRSPHAGGNSKRRFRSRPHRMDARDLLFPD
jgi:hypothetical protein